MLIVETAGLFSPDPALKKRPPQRQLNSTNHGNKHNKRDGIWGPPKERWVDPGNPEKSPSKGIDIIGNSNREKTKQKQNIHR